MWSHSRRLGSRLGPDITITSTSASVDRLSARYGDVTSMLDVAIERQEEKKLPGGSFQSSTLISRAVTRSQTSLGVRVRFRSEVRSIPI